MPFFPELPYKEYQCNGCGKWFIPGFVLCCVLHGPGTCCHYGETELTAEKATATPPAVVHSPWTQA